MEIMQAWLFFQVRKEIYKKKLITYGKDV